MDLHDPFRWPSPEGELAVGAGRDQPPEAQRDLGDLIRTHSLPSDTSQRVRRSLSVLRDFPLVGAALRGRWRNYRFLLGPWRWMVIVYRYDQEGDTAIVIRIYDGRSGSSPAGG